MTTASPTRNPFLALLGEVKGPVDTALEALLLHERRTFGALGDEVNAMLESAETLCRGGKRLRAGLIAAGFDAFARDPRPVNPQVIGAGVAVELLQSYFLIHDDWMDQDATRRGNPTVHTELARRFGGAHLGACSAVLAGDFLLTLAHREFHRVALATTKPAELLAAFTQMQLAAVVGQQLDVVGQTRNALSVYELKTGSYTVNGPLAVGALLGGANPDVLPALAGFAMPAGIGFQVRDDLLNLFTPSEQTGKPRGSDITSGKWTWTAQWVQSHAAADYRVVFERAFGNRDASPETLAAALQCVEDCGAREATENFVREQERACLEALARLTASRILTERGGSLLGAAVQALLHRSI